MYRVLASDPVQERRAQRTHPEYKKPELIDLALAHTVERVFLGWDHPLLPTAAAHLIEHYIEGPVADLRPATIILPGRRARRRVIELLLDEAEVRGATLIPPQATTVGGLPELLHTSPKPFADEPTSRRAWSRALRDVDRETVERGPSPVYLKATVPPSGTSSPGCWSVSMKH